MKLFAYLLLGVAFLCWLSGFLWAGFDLRWWAPLDDAPGRTMMLVMMHIFGGLACSVSGAFLLSEIDE